MPSIIPNHIYDIYALQHPQIKKPNVITITDEKFITDNGTPICSSCREKTIFLYDTQTGQLCSFCSWEIYGERKQCSLCDRKYGCESCGSTEDLILIFNKLVLCRDPLCLLSFDLFELDSPEEKIRMPFDLKCTCRERAYNKIKENLCEDMAYILDSYVSFRLAQTYPSELHDLIRTAFSISGCEKCFFESNFSRATFERFDPCNCFNSIV